MKRREEAKRKAEEEARAIREMMSKPKTGVQKAKPEPKQDGKKPADKKKGNKNTMQQDRDDDNGGKKRVVASTQAATTRIIPVSGKKVSTVAIVAMLA